MDGFDALNLLRAGESGTVSACDAEEGIRRRLMDIGLVSGARVDCLHKSPLGDPTAYRIFGAVIALRSEDAAHVRIRREVRP